MMQVTLSWMEMAVTAKSQKSFARRKPKDNKSAYWLRLCILCTCALGMVASLYALHVEMSKELDPSYKAMCDLSEWMSCSKVFTSRYGRGFGLVDRIFAKDSFLNQPNSVFGLAFYTFQTILAFRQTYVEAVVQLTASVLANLGSVYLGYILYFILHDFCIVCVSTYVINFLMLILTMVKFRRAKAEEKKNQ